MKQRVNWTLDAITVKRLEYLRLKHPHKMSQSTLIDYIVRKHCEDKKSWIVEEKKRLAQQIYELDQRMKEVEGDD